MAKMRTALVVLCASVAHAQADPIRLHDQGRYAEAARAFRKALEEDGDDARLNYNLAATLWRLGEFDDAETRAEKAATLGQLDALRDGILGNLRFEAALKKAGEQPKGQPRSKVLEEALDLMVQARKHYQRGALRPGATPALARNLERAIRKEEELRKQLEEQKQKEEDQKRKQQDKDKQQQDKDKQDKEQDKEQKDKDQQDQDQKDQPKQDPKQDQQPQPRKKRPRLGKSDPGKELTEEQRKRLLRLLKQIEARLQELQKQKQARRPKVKKDW